MANEYAVDAHGLIWFLAGNQRLGGKALGILQDPGNRLYVPIIALAEACWAVARGKTGIASVAALLAGIDSDPRFVVVPLERAILDLSLGLIAIGEIHDRHRRVCRC
jgi:PIN domain nuclease of toxin-antitoxin system